MACPRVPSSPNVSDHRAHLRLQSLGWALLAATFCCGLSLLLPWPQDGLARLDSALRAGGCGFFYGLLAFHLQRVDPDDGHLQAGLVGAICAIRSLAAPFPWSATWPLVPVGSGPFTLEELTGGLSSLMMGALLIWLPLWWPLIGSALLLQWAQRLLPAPRP
ncbi:MAG: hypothetical protein VKO19_06905 [Cyanobacteriota bacterium]|jgi:hypothetical protein|nr:hypothetical protein [Cyanobacteriota bacterium]